MMSEAIAPRRLSPVSPLFDAYTAGRQLIVPLIVAAAVEQLLGLILLAVAVTALRLAWWFRRTYAIREGALVLDEGLIRRKQRIVPIERIQQVNVERKLRHRVFGVAHLKIQTASSGSGAELDLDAVTDAEAERLRRALARPPEASAAAAEPAPPGSALAHMTYGEAAMSGVTDARLPLFAAIIAGAAQLAEVFGDRVGTRLEQITTALDLTGPLVVVAAAVGILGVVIFWVAIGALSGVLANAEYSLVADGDRLTCTRGLLSKREVVLLRHRIQMVRIEASPLRRALGRCGLVVQSAGKTGEADRIELPYLRVGDVERLVDALLPGTRPLPALQRHPIAALRRLRLRRAIIAVPFAAVAVTGALMGDGRWALAAPLVLLAAWVHAELSYLGLASGYSRGVLLSQRGAVVRKLVVVPATRAQSARLRSSPWQRRSQLATFSVDVAGGGQTPDVVDAAASDLSALVNRLLQDRKQPPASVV